MISIKALKRRRPSRLDPRSYSAAVGQDNRVYFAVRTSKGSDGSETWRWAKVDEHSGLHVQEGDIYGLTPISVDIACWEDR